MIIIHFADVHFDEKNHDEAEKCMDYMISKAVTSYPDVIICSGDVTNSQYLNADTRSARTIARQFRQLSDIAPVAVVVGTPSHDGMTPEILEFVSGKFPIVVSSKPEQVTLCREPDGRIIWNHFSPGLKEDVLLVLTQIPAPTKEHWQNRQGVEDDNQNISTAMAAIFTMFGSMADNYDDVPHVLNGHFSMAGSKISDHQLLPGTDIAISKEALAMSKAELVCLGHIHMAQEYSLPGGAKAFHAGSIFRKDFGERNEDKGFFIHTLDDRSTTQGNKSEFVTTPTREMAHKRFDCIKHPEFLTDQDNGLAERIVSELSGALDKGAWVKVSITIWIDEVRMMNQSQIKQVLTEAGATHVTLEIDRVRRENSREEQILTAESLVDKVKALAEHRSRPAPDGSFEIFAEIERLNGQDLALYARGRLNRFIERESEIINAEVIHMPETESNQEVTRESA